MVVVVGAVVVLVVVVLVVVVLVLVVVVVVGLSADIALAVDESFPEAGKTLLASSPRKLPGGS